MKQRAGVGTSCGERGIFRRAAGYFAFAGHEVVEAQDAASALNALTKTLDPDVSSWTSASRIQPTWDSSPRFVAWRPRAP